MLAVPLTACGGLLESQLSGVGAAPGFSTGEGGATLPPDAGADAAPFGEDGGPCGAWLPPDGSDEGCILELTASGRTSDDGGGTATASWEGGESFGRLEELLTYFRQLAEANALVDPTRAVDCSPGAPPAACTYDPRSPRVSASDVHYSDAVNRFVGPDGHAYVWGYLQTRNVWVVGDVEASPVAYCAVLQCNASAP